MALASGDGQGEQDRGEREVVQRIVSGSGGGRGAHEVKRGHRVHRADIPEKSEENFEGLPPLPTKTRGGFGVARLLSVNELMTTAI